MENNLSFETIVLVVFSFSLLAIILGVAIGFRKLHKKLNWIIALITYTGEHKENDIYCAGNKGQDDFPDCTYVTKLDKGYQHEASKKDSCNKDKSSSHR